MLRTPRERFVNSPDFDAFKKVVQAPCFEEATITALLELERDLPLECPLPQMAADAHQQMVGARKYLEILCSLHQPQTTPKPASKGLNYQAGI